MAKENASKEFFVEVHVQLTPTVVRKDGTGEATTSSYYNEALVKTLKDSSAKTTIFKKVGRFFDYEIVEEKFFANSSVTVHCKVFKENELKEFEESFHSKQLAKRLEQYLTSVGFLQELNITHDKDKEFRLNVNIDKKCFTQKFSGSTKSTGELKAEEEEKLKRKHNAERSGDYSENGVSSNFHQPNFVQIPTFSMFKRPAFGEGKGVVLFFPRGRFLVSLFSVCDSNFRSAAMFDLYHVYSEHIGFL